MKKRSSLRLRLLLSIAVLAAVQLLGMRSNAEDKMPATYQVKIDNFSFNPPTLTVPVGAKVTWTNRDDIPHNIVSSEQKFKSKPLDTDDQYTNTFSEAGTYQYFCGLHPKMVGKIVVTKDGK